MRSAPTTLTAATIARVTPEPATPAPVQVVSTARVLTTLMVPLFMALIAISVINVALPVIGTTLDADSSGLQWVVSGYALAFGLLLVPSGRLGDATGRKRLFLAGIAVFALGGLLAGFAQSIEMLNLARVIQGVGSGMLNPQTFGLIQKYFRKEARARAFATMATTVSIATASGPLIGGLLIEALGEDVGWRAMFLVNVPLGVLALVLGHRWLPDDRRLTRPAGLDDESDVGGSKARAGELARREREKLDVDESAVASLSSSSTSSSSPAAAGPTHRTVRRRRRLDLDPVGILILGLAVLSIMLPFLGRDLPVAMWALVPLGLVLLGVFAWWERRYERIGRPPLVNPEIFRDAGFRNGMIIVSVYFIGGTSLWIVMPLFLQMHLGYAPIDSAMISLPASVCAAVSAQVAGRFVLRLGRRMVITGFCGTISGLLLFIVLAGYVDSGALHYLVFMIPAAVMGLSQGMTISPNQTLTLRAVDPAYGGVAGSIISLGQRMGTAVGTAIVPGVLFGLVATRGDWLLAFRASIGLIAVLAAAALAVSIVDRRRELRVARAAQAGAAAAPGPPGP